MVLTATDKLKQSLCLFTGRLGLRYTASMSPIQPLETTE